MSLDFWERVCILIVLVIALWSIIKLFLPYLEAQMPALVVQIINIIIWAGIAILCIIIVFALLACIWGAVGGLIGHPFRASLLALPVLG
jgi:hypothetical protein